MEEIYELLKGMNLDARRTIVFEFPHFMDRDEFLEKYEETTGSSIEAGYNRFTQNVEGKFEFSHSSPEARIRLEQESVEFLKGKREEYGGADEEAYVKYALEPGFDEIELGLEANKNS